MNCTAVKIKGLYFDMYLLMDRIIPINEIKVGFEKWIVAQPMGYLDGLEAVRHDIIMGNPPEFLMAEKRKEMGR